MALGKRTLTVGKKELEELFGLPEGAEILAVRPSGLGGAQGWEFLVVSDGVIDGLTVEQKEEHMTYRRIGLHTIAKWKESEVDK